MKNSGQSEIRKVVENRSWFRDTPHYWAKGSLPLAYAVACVEVVSKSSQKPATHLVDAALRRGAKIVSVGVGKTPVSRKRVLTKNEDSSTI